MRFIHLYLCVVFLCCSCKEYRKEKINCLIREWNGKELIFPMHSVFTIQGRDTVDVNISNFQYKIVTYIDSTGCTSCKLQLPRWKRFINEVDSLVKGSVIFLFYFHPQNAKEIYYITQRDNFMEFISIDDADEFNRCNNIPNESTLQTFLLNSENRVLAIGNPIYHPKVKELYLEIIDGNKSLPSYLSLTEISISQKIIDCGSFNGSESKKCEFKIKNIGHDNLVIHDVITSCGCTKVEYSKVPINVGDETIITVFYEAEEKGYFKKTIDVYCNIAASSIQLTICGTVK